MMMKMEIRGLSIKLKIMIVTNVLVICTIGLLSYSFLRQMKADMVYMGVEQARIAARMAVLRIDGDALERLEIGDEDTAAYQELLSRLRGIRQECGMAYLYTLTADAQSVYYGVDTDESSHRNAIGTGFETSYAELEKVFRGEEYVQEYIDDTEDGKLITAYVPIRNSDNQIVAILGSDFNASGIVEKMNGTRTFILILSLVSIAAALLILNLVIGSVTKSIKTVNEKLCELIHSEGDLTRTLKVKTGDEMEVMAENVNELLRYIHKIMVHISEDSGTLNTSTELIVKSLAGAGENILDISASMEEMSAAMEESTASLNRIRLSVVDVYDRINNISGKAGEGNASTEKIAAKAQKIHRDAAADQKNAHSMAKEMAKSVNAKIEKAKSVEEINILTENIINITEQTNLLALNASIEAARAGETGRGFAVVANEIGKLAADSASIAEKIRQVSSDVISSVEELAAEAEKMIEFMENTAMDGYHKLLTMSDDYSSNADEIHEVMERFADDSANLKQTVDYIRETMSHISIAVEESTKGILTVAEMSEELSDGVKDIGSRADINKQIVGRLDAEINKFKL